MTAFKVSAFFACATLLASASAAFGSDFNPQPDPPRHGVTATTPPKTADFNPQPDPPGKHGKVSLDFNPQPDPPGKHPATTAAAGGCTQTSHSTNRDAASGLPSGKRTPGTDISAAGAGSAGGETVHPCGFERGH
jgi:hypothetical protein